MQFINPKLILINPYQPRKVFREEDLYNLAESIKEYGILQPLLVRKVEDKYYLIAGERRLRAALLLKLDTVPVLVDDFSNVDIAVVALVENIQRKNLNAIEEALGYRGLIEEFHLTQEALAKKIGKSRVYVANILRLLHLSDKIQKLLLDNKISYGVVKPLISIKDEEVQNSFAEKILKENLTARKVEKLVRDYLKKGTEKKVAPKEKYRYLEEICSRRLGTKVKISKQKNKAKLEIEFYSEEDLNRIIDILNPRDREITKVKNFCI